MASPVSSHDLSAKWISTVADIPDSDWYSLFGGNVIKRKEFHQAIENAGFDDIDVHYLVISLSGRTVSIVPCFVYDIDLINLVSAKGPSAFFRNVRKIFPGLLRVRSFVTGTYAASCEPFIDMTEGLSDEDRMRIKDLIGTELKRKYAETRCKFIFVKDARENSISKVREILPADFTYLVSFPTSLIPILDDYPFPTGLKTKSKQRVRNIEKKFDERFRWEIVTDFSALNHDYYIRYRNVLEKAANKFEFLNEKFFSEINRLYGDDAYMLVARDKKTDEIRLMTLILEDDVRLVPLYLGIKYMEDDTRILYLANIFRIVREAEKRGKKIIEFGQTSYYPKSLSGAVVENIYYGFWSDKPFYRLLINRLFGRIFAPPAIPGNAYRTQVLEAVRQRLEQCGVIPRV